MSNNFQKVAIGLLAIALFSSVSTPSAKAGPSIGIVNINASPDYQTLLTNLGFPYTLITSPPSLADLTSYDIVIYDDYSGLDLTNAEASRFNTAFAQGTSFFLSIDDISGYAAADEAIFRTLVGASDFANGPDTPTPQILASFFPNGCPTNSAGLILDFVEGDEEVVTCATCVVLDDWNEIVIRQVGDQGVLYLGDTIGSVTDLSAGGTLGTLFQAFYNSIWGCRRPRVDTTKPIMPLATNRISEATELLSKAENLCQELSEKEDPKFEECCSEDKFNEAKELLEMAEKFFMGGNYIAANNFALKAITKLEEIIECCEG